MGTHERKVAGVLLGHKWKKPFGVPGRGRVGYRNALAGTLQTAQCHAGKDGRQRDVSGARQLRAKAMRVSAMRASGVIRSAALRAMASFGMPKTTQDCSSCAMVWAPA